MTFSILGYCSETGQVGLALSSVTMGVGGISPTYSYCGGIVVVQAKGNPRAGIAGAKVLDAGGTASDAMDAVAAADVDVEERQIAIMDRKGRIAARTGAKNGSWAGEAVGADRVAFGNVLRGPEVVEAMAGAFDQTAGRSLAERLLSALEAGRNAGGQQAPNGRRYSERGAALRVVGTDQFPEIAAVDLRVDIQFDAVTQLRELYETYKPVVALRAMRAAEPERMPDLAEWESEHLADRPPPAVYSTQAQ